MLFFMISFNLIMPELNSVITDLGGAKWKGLLITVFTISAAISRPFSGKLSDYIGRKKVVFVGYLLCAIVSLLYSFVSSVFVFLVLRFFHGFSVGFAPTGATALITDILPSDKRGVGMGIWGTFISLGIGVGQVLGSPIADAFSLNGLFFASFLSVVLSFVFLLFAEETLGNKHVFKVKMLKIKKGDVFDKNVFPSAIVMFLTSSCSGIVFVLVPDIAEYLKLDNKGWFFFFYVFTTIFVRFFTGKVSDHLGRRKTLLIGVILLLISMLLLAFYHSLFSFTVSAIVFGLATGLNSPSLFAWTADLSHPDRRGVGAGTMFIALEVGIMFGSFSTLFLYTNTLQSASFAFMYGVFTSVLAICYLVYQLKYVTSKT